jgi:hypothetical protein
MHPRLTPYRVVLLAIVLSLMLAPSGRACNIPVFRYALERWRAERVTDLYRVMIFHRGALSEREEQLVAALRTSSERDQAPANLLVETVDLKGEPDEFARTVWESHKDAGLPLMVLRYPDSAAEAPAAWASPLTRDTVRQLLDSPVRQELAKRILSGHSVVWILMESGKPEVDKQAADLLSKQMPELQKEITLPPDDPTIPLLSPLPLRLKFSFVRLKRDDPEEEAFVQILLNSEKDLHEIKGAMAFPVFGRGRALFALADKGLNATLLHEDAEFLTGPCSCQVKRLNPGFDLLMTVDWDSILEDRDAAVPELALPAPLSGTVRLPDPALREAIAKPAPETVEEEKTHEEAPVLLGYSRMFHWVMAVGLALAGLCVLVTGYFAFRGRPVPPPPSS